STILNSEEVNNYGKKLNMNFYKPHCMLDELVGKAESRESRVVNLDKSSGPGTHYVCYYRFGNNKIFYDSFGLTLPIKIQKYIINKKTIIEINIKKLKRKRKIIKILYYSSVILSISLSGVIVSLSPFIGILPIVITILSASSGILTGLSTKFNLESKRVQISDLIVKLNELNNTLDYVITCNGDLSQEEYNKILKSFNY